MYSLRLAPQCFTVTSLSTDCAQPAGKKKKLKYVPFMAHGETVYDVIESDLGAALVSAFNLI